MKRAKLLSLFLAGSLLFQTAGIDVLAAAPSDPAPISETFDNADTDITQQPADEDEKDNDPVGNGSDSEQPSGEENKDDDPAADAENPEQPDDEEGKDDDSAADAENPEQPDDEEGKDDDPAADAENPEQPDDGENEGEDPDTEDGETEDTVSENTVSENTISENTLAEEDSLFSIFPGLGDSYQFSTQELADKRVLSSHVGDVVKISSLENATLTDFKDASDSYVPGEVVYMADSLEEAEQVAAAFGGTLDSYAYEVACISLPEKATVALAIAAAAQPEIKLPAVWPNYYQYLYEEDTYSTIGTYKPTDPNYNDQWFHDYIGTRYAWAAGYKGQGVKVAVIDTGLKANHEDLTANALQGKNFVGMGGKSESAVAPDYNVDNQTHGTHVAGIIAADDNTTGGVGIAPDAKVAGFCVFPADGGADSLDTIRAIKAAVADKYDIINMSLGGAYYDGNYEKAVNDARIAGVAIFAAAGNEDISANAYPAAYAGTISVGAVDENASRASFSNYGGTVNLSFPGVDIYSTTNTGYYDKNLDKTYGAYDKMSGTSMACPAAAGTAAVILSARADIKKKTGKARVDALLSAMKSSTTKCTDSGMGAGTTYLPGVLKIATDMTAPETPVITIAGTPVDKAGKTYIAEQVTATLSSATAVGVDIYYSTDGKTPTYKNGAVTNAANTTPYTLGTQITLTGAKSKTIKAIAVNPLSGKVSKVASKTVTLTPIPTRVTVAPVGNVTKIAAGKSLKFTATVAPDYAISKNVSWTVVDASGSDAKSKGVTVANGTVKTSSTKTLTTPAGTYTVIATAVGSTDLKKFNGQTDEYEFTVIESSNIKKVAFIDAANKNRAPAAKSIKTTDHKTTDTNVRLNLSDYLTVTTPGTTSKDPDITLKGSDALAKVVWSSSNTKVATVSNTGLITAVAPGKATIKATSNDGLNKSASYNVTVVQPVTGITISGPTKVAVGKSIALTAAVTPDYATNKKLEWTVTDNSTGQASDKVTIGKNNGRVTTKKNATGTFTVTAKAADGLTAENGSPVATPATYTISIENQEITEIKFKDNTTKLTLFPPKTSAATATTTAKLVPVIKGKAAGSREIKEISTTLINWTSSAPAIASVDQSGNIKAIAPGKATITCAATDGSNKKATCTVTVSVPMSKLVIGPKDGYDGHIAVGKNVKMVAKYYSNFGTPSSKKIVWSIVNSTNVPSGKVSIHKDNGTVSVAKDVTPGGSVTVQATAQDGSGVTSNQFTLYIWPNFIAAEIAFEYINDDSYTGYFYIVATADKIQTGKYKGKPDWTKAVILPDYCTASVSGAKNAGLKKIDGSNGALYQPIPEKSTTLMLDDDPTAIDKLKVSDLTKMSLTIKLKDGSNLTAKANNIYAIRYPKRYSDGIGMTVGYFSVVKK